jgi:hypothetical protein
VVRRGAVADGLRDGIGALYSCAVLVATRYATKRRSSSKVPPESRAIGGRAGKICQILWLTSLLEQKTSPLICDRSQ